MILTYKIRHNFNLNSELAKAKQIAEFVILHKDKRSSADVKQFGLKSVISNQILRKYGRDKKAKSVKSVNLIIPNQGIKLNKTIKGIEIPALKIKFPYRIDRDFEKVNQIEINKDYIFVSVSVKVPPITVTDKYIGVDLNTTGHCAVATNPDTGKVWKMGKKAHYIHSKYKNMRKRLQKQGKYKKVKQIKNKEQRILKDLNHKISRKIVNIARENGCGIKLEKLEGIRNNKKHRKSFNYSLNSWSFNQLQQMIDYKAKLLGIDVVYIDPHYTSQVCSKCGALGNRNGKVFGCPKCGVENADVNASFNIARHRSERESIIQLFIERVMNKGSTDTPKEAIA